MTGNTGHLGVFIVVRLRSEIQQGKRFWHKLSTEYVSAVIKGIFIKQSTLYMTSTVSSIRI